MNSLEMVEENVKTASEARVGDFGPSDFALIQAVVQEIQQKEKVGCTGCGYCMPCPQGIDIPTLFRCYNTMYSERKQAGRSQYVLSASFTREAAFASACIRCGKCETHCPQGIPIREKIKEADKALRPLHYRIFTAIVRGNMYRKTRRKLKQS